MNNVSKKYHQEMEAKAWREGAFVMLHPVCYMAKDKLHPDSGRIGKISVCDGQRMVVQFENDDLVGKSTFCLLPKDAWLPMPDFMIESYNRKTGITAWKLSDRGLQIANSMDWKYTEASKGNL
jgi:hypothetical protein